MLGDLLDQLLSNVLGIELATKLELNYLIFGDVLVDNLCGWCGGVGGRSLIGEGVCEV